MLLVKCKHRAPTLLIILIFFATKSTSQLISETNSKENPRDAKPDNSDLPDNASDQEENSEVNPDLKQSNEKEEETDLQASKPQDEKVEESQSEAGGNPQKVSEETKKENVKLDENIRKISLSDVNSISYDESHPKQVKRETRTTEFLGLPRDASYFFDDLEPFINNNNVKDYTQESPRAARAIPARESRAQKAKLGSRKEIMDEEAEEEEEDDNEKVEEDEEKGSEGDYDDDDDMEPDCQPTTADSCTSSTECAPSTTECSPPTTTCPTTTTTKCTTKPTTCPTPRKTTTKCTTRFMCPTKCPTTVESTKCPRICAKGIDKQNHYPVAEKTKSWDSETKRTKKKFRNKINPNN